MDEALFKNRAIRFGVLAGNVIHAMNNLMQDYADNRTLRQSMNAADYEHFHRSNLDVIKSAKRLLKYGDKSFNYFSKYQYTTVQVISDKNSIIRDLRLKDEAYMTLHNRRRSPAPRYTPVRKSHHHKPSLGEAIKIAREHGYKLMNSKVSNKIPFSPTPSDHQKENKASKKIEGDDLYGAAKPATRPSASSHDNERSTEASVSSNSVASSSASKSSESTESSSTISYHSSDPTMDDIIKPSVKSLGDKVYSNSGTATSNTPKGNNSADSQSDEPAKSSSSSDSAKATGTSELNLNPKKSE